MEGILNGLILYMGILVLKRVKDNRVFLHQFMSFGCIFKFFEN